jgi:hypothetical protein
MKLSSDSAAADRIEARLRSLPVQLSSYESGQLPILCELAHTVVMGEEYWIKSKREPVLTGPYQAATERWYRNIYAEQIILVLKKGGLGPFGYTRSYVFKQLRGHLSHGDQNDRGRKDEVFRAFAFENEGPSTVEFALTWNWLNSGGLHFSSGNVDSHNPFREKVLINDRKVVVTTLESATLSAVAEFWYTFQYGDIPDTGRIAFMAEQSQLETRFGADLGRSCFETVQWQIREGARLRAQKRQQRINEVRTKFLSLD